MMQSSICSYWVMSHGCLFSGSRGAGIRCPGIWAVNRMPYVDLNLCCGLLFVFRQKDEVHGKIHVILLLWHFNRRVWHTAFVCMHIILIIYYFDVSLTIPHGKTRCMKPMNSIVPTIVCVVNRHPLSHANSKMSR